MSTKWTEKEGVVYFSLFSDAKTGSEWLRHFSRLKVGVSLNATKILQSAEFLPSSAGTLHKVAVIKGNVFNQRVRSTEQIRKWALLQGFRIPNLEVSPHIRSSFSNEEIKEMGLEEIVTFHEPVNGRFLDIDADTGELESAPAGEEDTWHEEHGFGFVL